MIKTNQKELLGKAEDFADTVSILLLLLLSIITAVFLVDFNIEY